MKYLSFRLKSDNNREMFVIIFKIFKNFGEVRNYTKIALNSLNSSPSIKKALLETGNNGIR
jgi:hypothetical protein